MKRLLFFKILLYLVWPAILIFLGIYIVFYFKDMRIGSSSLYAPFFEAPRGTLETYTLIPNWRGIDHGVEININKNGFRGEDWNIDLKNSGYRILVIGDSQTFGVGLSWNKVFSQLLQSSLNKITKTTVYNIAVPGWNLNDERKALEHYVPILKPDLVVQLYISNDLDSNITAGEFHQLKAVKKKLQPYFSYTDPWVMESFANLYIEKGNAKFDLQEIIINNMNSINKIKVIESLFLLNISSSGKALYLNYDNNIKSIVNLSKENKFNLVVLLDCRFPGGKQQQELEKILSNNTVSYFVLNKWTGDQDNYIQNWSLFPKDSHGNEKYHELLSKITMKKIMASNWIANKLKSVDQIPPPINGEIYKKLEDQTLVFENDLIKNITDGLTLTNPKSLRSTISIGKDISQFRFLVKTEKECNVLKFRVAKPTEKINEKELFVFLEVETTSLFTQAYFDEKEGFWNVKLPIRIDSGKITELGLIVGINVNGFFEPIFPLESVYVDHKNVFGYEGIKKPPVFVLDDYTQIESDHWMAPVSRFNIHSSIFKNVIKKFRYLKINFDPVTNQFSVPVTVSTKIQSDSSGNVFKKNYILDKMNSSILIKLDEIRENSDIEMIFNQFFIPSQINKESSDIRKLSAHIQSAEFI